MTKLGFSPHDFAPANDRPPMYNAGQYTGEPCAPGAGWCPVPMKPNAGWLVATGLLSANPPPGATTQPASLHRPGNNSYAPPASYGLEHGFIRCPPSANKVSTRQR
jgi:hypothetical protein